MAPEGKGGSNAPKAEEQPRAQQQAAKAASEQPRGASAEGEGLGAGPLPRADEAEVVAARSADPRTPESPPVEEVETDPSKRRGRGRVRALSNMSHVDANNVMRHEVKVGDELSDDDPLVAMHPHMFVRV